MSSRTPSVKELLKHVPEAVQHTFSSLSSAMSDRVGVQEKVVYDRFANEWTPAYYLGKRQLFHVHLNEESIVVSMPGGRKLISEIVASPQVDGGFKEQLRGLSWMTLRLKGRADVTRFQGILRIRYSMLAGD